MTWVRTKKVLLWRTICIKVTIYAWPGLKTHMGEMSNDIVNTSLPDAWWGTISSIPKTILVPPQTSDSLTHIYFYMYDVLSAVQGVPDLQHWVFGSTVRALRWLFLSLLGEIKYSATVKTLVVGEGNKYQPKDK